MGRVIVFIRLRSYLLVGSALIACAGVAQAAPITVVNGSFETQLVLTGGTSAPGETWNSLSPTGAWAYTANASSPYGVYGIGSAINGDSHFATAADGVFLANTAAAVDGSTPKVVSQVLSYTVTAGDIFTLEFDVAKGLKDNDDVRTLLAEIVVGSTTIATQNNFASTLAKGDWDHKTLTGTATTTGALKIVFGQGTTSSMPWLDNVTMSVAAVPEPASLGLLSLAGLALMRRRK